MTKKKSFWYALLCLLSSVQPASAAYFDSLIYDMTADRTFISRPMVNDTDRTNLYTLTAYKIDRPGKGGENRISGGEMEVVYTPLKFTVQPGGKEYFKLFYRGPQDNIERYYRVIFKESPIRLFPFKNQQQNTDIIPVVAVSTLLVVRPRKTNLAFEVDEKTGVIRNTGNTFFRVIIQQGCNGNDESSQQFYMLPGETWRNASARANNKKFIVALGRYYPVGNGCFPAA